MNQEVTKRPEIFLRLFSIIFSILLQLGDVLLGDVGLAQQVHQDRGEVVGGVVGPGVRSVGHDGTHPILQPGGPVLEIKFKLTNDHHDHNHHHRHHHHITVEEFSLEKILLMTNYSSKEMERLRRCGQVQVRAALGEVRGEAERGGGDAQPGDD